MNKTKLVQHHFNSIVTHVPYEYTLNELEYMLNTTRKTLLSHIKQGKLHGTKRDGAWRITEEEVERYTGRKVEEKGAEPFTFYADKYEDAKQKADQVLLTIKALIKAANVFKAMNQITAEQYDAMTDNELITECVNDAKRVKDICKRGIYYLQKSPSERTTLPYPTNDEISFINAYKAMDVYEDILTAKRP